MELMVDGMYLSFHSKPGPGIFANKQLNTSATDLRKWTNSELSLNPETVP